MQGAATSALTANNAIAAGMQNRETLSQTGNRVGNALADISGRRTDVESTRGGLEAKNVLGLRQSEFENAVVGQELDLKAAGVAVDAASAEAKAKGDADSKRQEFIAKYGVSPERWRGMSPKERLSWKRKWESDGKPPPAGKVTDNYGYTDEEYGRMSPAQRRKAKARWEKAGKSSSGGKESEASNKAQANILGAESWVERYIADQNWDPSKMSDNEKKKYRGQANARGLKTLTNKDGEVTRDAFDPIVLSVALDLAFDGRISRRNIGRLEALDIKVTSDGRLA